MEAGVRQIQAAACKSVNETCVHACRYDDHRDAILRSGDRHQAGAEGFSAGQKPEDFVDLYAFFSKSCFTGYNDGPQVT